MLESPNDWKLGLYTPEGLSTTTVVEYAKIMVLPRNWWSVHDRRSGARHHNFCGAFTASAIERTTTNSVESTLTYTVLRPLQCKRTILKPCL